MPRLPVIANQRARWCGNPPVREEMYRQFPYRAEKYSIFGGNRYLVPFNRGIATEAVALARNDSISLQIPICRTGAVGIDPERMPRLGIPNRFPDDPFS